MNPLNHMGNFKDGNKGVHYKENCYNRKRAGRGDGRRTKN